MKIWRLIMTFFLLGLVFCYSLLYRRTCSDYEFIWSWPVVVGGESLVGVHLLDSLSLSLLYYFLTCAWYHPACGDVLTCGWTCSCL